MVEIFAKTAEVESKAVEKLGEVSSSIKETIYKLDAPLNVEDADELISRVDREDSLDNLDKPLNLNQGIDEGEKTKPEKYDDKEIGKPEQMEPQVEIKFSCPEGIDREEFVRQLKGQERGLNSQTLAENMDNRAAFERRKAETGNGRDLSEGKKAQDIAREKATQRRIESNQNKGMSYSEAKAETESWIKTQAALHNPDQIAGGDPTKVSRMGDANVNSSIGAQWRTRVEQLSGSIEEYAKGKSREELENTKMNVKLVAA